MKGDFAKMHKTIKVCFYQIKQIFSTPRIPLLFILIAIFIYATVQPVSDFAKDVGILPTPWAFPHITNDYICQLVIMAGVILLFCDAPFKSDAYIYIIHRAGNISWVMGMCLYIFSLAFLYIMVVFVATLLALLPSIELQNGWGKIWGTLARTQAGNQIGLAFSVNDYIVGAYLPVQATIISFLLEWACCAWLGLITYFFNNITDSVMGSLIAAAFVFIDITVTNEWDYTFYRISPVTLAQIHTLSGSQSMFGLTLKYAIGFFLLSIAFFVILCLLMPYAGKKFFVKHRLKEGK